MALKDYHLPFLERDATAIIFSPVCQHCHYIFNLDDVKLYNVRDAYGKMLPHREISPNICPQCGKQIEKLIVPDLASMLSERE